MRFVNAMNSRGSAAMTTTTNGMAAHVATGNAVLDLFRTMGASRQVAETELTRRFSAALRYDQLLAVKAAFHNRDVREGQGERRSFRVFYQYLCSTLPDVANANIPNVPFYGRWDDLFVAIGTPVEENALAYIAGNLLAGDALCAKWMPRLGSKQHKYAVALKEFMKLDWKEYRLLLSGNTKVVETLMCAKRWSDIDYNKTPSQAINRYRKAWYRNDGERYKAWVNALSKGVPGVKVNAATLHPHQITSKLHGLYAGTEVDLLEAQWKALPNWLTEERKILPVIDVSGSMSGQPMDVAVALGLYIAERNKGLFHNAYFTFDTNPQFRVASGSLKERVDEVYSAPWGGSTDLGKTFKILLKKACEAQLAPEEMPSVILILSDMQFNGPRDGLGGTALQMIDRLYAQAGYTRPTIVFWNLRDAQGSPAKADSNGTMMISGFSPSIMKAVLAGTTPEKAPEITPEQLMLETLNAERYDRVTLDGVSPDAEKPRVKGRRKAA